MARRVRGHDWAATALGPIENWPERIKVVVELVLNSPLVSSLVLFEQRLLIYNDTAAHLYGENHPHALGEPLAKTFPDSFPQVSALYDRVFAGETVQVHAQPLAVGTDGPSEVFDACPTPVRDAEGSVIGAHMVGLEVGDRLRAETALRASEERYRAFVNTSADVVYRMSADWSHMKELDGNGIIADTAEPDADWMARHILTEDRAAVREAVDAAIRDCAIFELEHGVIRANGTPGWTRSRAIPILDQAGTIVEWLGTATDITDRRLAEQALRDSEAIRTIALASGRMGSWRWNLAKRQVTGDAHFMALWGLPPSDEPLPLSVFTDRQLVAGVGQTEGVVGKTMANGEEFDAEIEVGSGPTAGRWLRWRGRPSPDDPSVIYGVTFDVTEQKLADKRLHESEEQLRAILGQAPMAIAFTGASGEILFRNAIFDQLWGHPAHAAAAHINDEIYQGYHLDGRTVVSGEWPGARALLNGETVRSEVLEIVNLQGRRIPCSFDAGPIHDVAGGVIGAVIMFRDVTAEFAAQRAVRESEARFRLVADNISQLAWTCDRLGHVNWYNKRWYDYTGLTFDDMQSWGWDKVQHPEHAARVIAGVERAAATGEPWEDTFPLRRRDGQYRWFFSRARPIRDEQGNIVQWFGTNTDITDLVAAEDQFRASEARQRALLEGIPQLVWRAAADGQWTWASPQWVDFTGQTEEDSHGSGWLNPVYPDDRSHVRERWNGAIEGGEFHADYRVYHAAEGRYRWVQTRATPVRNDQGAIVEWLGTSTDVEDLRSLRDRQQVLLAELQHRVRNILAIIRSIMRRSLDGEQSLHDYAQHLEGRLTAMARTQVLLTRQVGEDVDLENMIRDELLAQTADEKRIDLSGPEVGISPKAAEVLTLAIHELATNSLKYGAIGRSDARLKIGWRIEMRDNARWLKIEWIETGVPIASSAPRRIGFGTELITRRVPYELKGEGSFDIRPGGLVCEIAFPLIDRASILETESADFSGDA